MEPCGALWYAIFNILDFRSFIIDCCILSSVTEIAFEPIKSYSSDAIMVLFGKDTMTDSVKGFLQSMKTPQATLP